MSSLIITPNIGSAIVTSADAARLTRDELIKSAALVTTVTDRIDADDATGVLKSLKDFTREIEAQRTAAKAPALEIGRKIDAMAKELVASVDTEANRISRVLGAFEAEERRKAEDIRRVADAEIARLAHEATQQANAAARTASTPEAADRASDAVIEKAQERIVAVRQQQVNAVVPKTAGTQVREDVCFEVENAKALYAAHPELVVLEPNGTAIRAILRANPNLQIPGLRHWREAKLNVR